MMCRLAFLVRHGESTLNTVGLLSNDLDRYPLTENGKEQALRMSEELKKIHIDSIVTSLMLRTGRTTGPLWVLGHGEDGGTGPTGVTVPLPPSLTVPPGHRQTELLTACLPAQLSAGNG